MIKVTLNNTNNCPSNGASSPNALPSNTLMPSAFQAVPQATVISINGQQSIAYPPTAAHYPNPPLAPRFLAQQTTSHVSTSIQQPQQQPQQMQQQQQQQQQQLRTNVPNFVPQSTKIQSSISLASTQGLMKPVQVQQSTTASLMPQQTSLIATLTAPNQTQQQASIQQQALPQCTLNNTLFVGNLHASLQEIDLIQVFRPFGRIVECCKKWLHFGFVKFSTEEEACHAYITLNGYRLKGRPMRLEFQNRTKKARIKAILAQAAIQAANNKQHESVVITHDDFGTHHSALNNLLSGQQQTSYVGNIKEFVPASLKPSQLDHHQKASFFDTECLIKFATTGYTCEDEHREPSPIEHIWSTSSSCSMTRPLTIDPLVDFVDDSRVQSTIRSVFFSSSTVNSDSDCGHSSDGKLNHETRSCDTPNEYTCSEHLEFTYSHTSKQTAASDDGKLTNSSSVNEYTSVDDDNDDDDDDVVDHDDDDKSSCISSNTSCDASLIGDLEPLEETTTNIKQPTDLNTKHTKAIATFHARGKLEFGIYCCINKTNSLFIQADDILKPLASGDYEEYRLFPLTTYDTTHLTTTTTATFYLPEILY